MRLRSVLISRKNSTVIPLELAPILAENSGWSLFITTPVGRYDALSMYIMARANPTSIVEQQRQEYHALYGEDAGDAFIQQEYWCSFNAAVLGARRISIPHRERPISPASAQLVRI
jgi:hypothetical protein